MFYSTGIVPAMLSRMARHEGGYCRVQLGHRRAIIMLTSAVMVTTVPEELPKMILTFSTNALRTGL